MTEYTDKCCGGKCYRLVDRLQTDDDFERAVGLDQHSPRCEICNQVCGLIEVVAKEEEK